MRLVIDGSKCSREGPEGRVPGVGAGSHARPSGRGARAGRGAGLHVFLPQLLVAGALALILSACATDNGVRAVPPQPPASIDEKAPAGVPTAQTPPQGSPALKAGTVEEAGKAIGARVRQPAYLPTGMSQEGSVMYATGTGTPIATIGYTGAGRAFAVKFIVEPVEAFSARKGEPSPLSSIQAKVHTQAKEPSDKSPATTTLLFRDGPSTTVMVTGDLPLEEMWKIARSF